MLKRLWFIFGLSMSFGVLGALAWAQSTNPAPAAAPPQGQTNGEKPGPDHRSDRPRRVGGRGLGGTVTSVGVDRFEIKSMDGSAHTVLVDDQTQYREGQKEIQLEDLKVGDHVMVLGKPSPTAASPTGTGAAALPAGSPAAPPATSANPAGAGSDQPGFTAAMVRRLTDADLQRFQAGGAMAGERVFGEIVSIDNNQLRVRNPRSGDETVVVVGAQTTFMKDNQASALKDLKVGDRIFALGQTVNAQFAATSVMSGQMRGGGQWRQRQPNPNQ